MNAQSVTDDPAKIQSSTCAIKADELHQNHVGGNDGRQDVCGAYERNTAPNGMKTAMNDPEKNTGSATILTDERLIEEENMCNAHDGENGVSEDAENDQEDLQSEDDLEELVHLDEDNRVAGVTGPEPSKWVAWSHALQSEHLNELKASAISACTQESFWLGCEDEPSCALEWLALDVFNAHTRNLHFNRQQSGVEWWVQRRGGGPESKQHLDLHIDKCESLCSDQGIIITPRISTVTYLTSSGAPTLVLDVCAPNEWDRLDIRYGNVNAACMSPTEAGSHFAFDGRFLHGVSDDIERMHSPEEERVTFLANIWLNYIPIDAERIPSEALEHYVRSAPTAWNSMSLLLQLRDNQQKKVLSFRERQEDAQYDTRSVGLHMEFGGITGRAHVLSTHISGSAIAQVRNKRPVVLHFEDQSCSLAANPDAPVGEQDRNNNGEVHGYENQCNLSNDFQVNDETTNNHVGTVEENLAALDTGNKRKRGDEQHGLHN